MKIWYQNAPITIVIGIAIIIGVLGFYGFEESVPPVTQQDLHIMIDE